VERKKWVKKAFGMSKSGGKNSIKKKPMLKWLNEHINWEDFRSILETIYDKERKSNAGRKPTDLIVMFKMLILHVCHQ
jgi:hypothetical protein